MQNLLYRTEVFNDEPKVEFFNTILGKTDIISVSFFEA